MSQVNVCRLCLNICKHYRSLYDKNGFGTEVYSLIIKYFDSTIINMDLEKQYTAVCLKCWYSLLNFNTFEQSVAKAQTKLSLGNVHKQEDVIIKSEENSENDTFDLNNEEEFIYLQESESNSVQRHEGFSIEFISEGDHASSRDDSEEFGDLIDTSVDDIFIDQDVKEIITLPESELLKAHDGGKVCSVNEVILPHKLKNCTEIITSNVSQNVDSRTRPYITQNDKEFDDIIAQWKNSLKCKLCSDSYSRYSLLRAHYQQKHPNDEFYISCCQRKFSNINLLEEHIRLHLNPTDFKCEICGNAYATSRKLTDHLLTQHSGLRVKRSFQCPKCPIRYNSEAKYKHHMAEHDNCEHDCSQCGKMFSTGNRRLLHERLSHGIYRHCQECGKSFRDNDDFTQHLLEHGDRIGAEDPLHVCTACGQTANTALEMRMHVATHMKVDVYMCSHCPKTFQYRSSLRNHIKKKHLEHYKGLRFKKSKAISANNN